MSVLVVDGANVVGSRPDGWWRDRAGAAARLHARLLAADPAALGADRVVLVLEGRARSGVGEGQDGAVETVHAATDGDSTIAAVARRLIEAGDHVVVITADRLLSETVERAAAQVRRPGWLLDALDP